MHKHWQAIILSFTLAASITGQATVAAYAYGDDGYVSPYKIEFTYPLADLTKIDSYPPRNSNKLESKSARDQWYSSRMRRQNGAWGPAARHYPAIADYDSLPLEFKRQRLLAVASSLIGLPYQHHHIPDWDPPANWPWKHVAYGRNSKGLDCSNFTSWVYNYGLGIKFNSAIGGQAELQKVSGPDGTIPLKIIYNHGDYEQLIHTLATGDLLYIRNKSGRISHVIIWVGQYGHSPNGVPLVIDSTGPEHRDCNGNAIPIGVQLRPFDQDSWYFKSFAHAHRIIY
jgi:cell wall-associated NlpC family hydrolase